MEEHKELNHEIGERIRAIRESQAKTREQLAEVAHISPQFLFDIETGRKGMTARTLIGIAVALNVSTDYILLGHTSKTAEIASLLEGLSAEQIQLAADFLKLFAKGAKDT